jgi:hypothetical protein
VGFVVDKVALGQVFSEYFSFPCQSLFNKLLHNHPYLSLGACIIGQKMKVADSPKTLVVIYQTTQHQIPTETNLITTMRNSNLMTYVTSEILTTV